MDWLNLRFYLFQALDSLEIHDIYLYEVDNKVLTLLIVTDNVEKLRPFTKMRVMDSLIQKNCPKLYSEYLFCYFLYDKKDWDMTAMTKASRIQRNALREFGKIELL